MSRCRQNFSSEAEAMINKQINLELHASYVYLSMSSWFTRDDQALHGFAKYYMQASDEEREHAKKLIEYQIKRGGTPVFQDVAKPNTMEWGTALQATEAALELEKTINQSLLALHKLADEKRDPHLTDFLEGNYLNEQVDAIKEFSDLVSKLRRAGEGVGVHILDREFIEG